MVPPTADILRLVVMGAGVLVITLALPRIWKHQRLPSGERDLPPGFLRGGQRGWAVLVACGWVFLAGYGFAAVWTTDIRSGGIAQLLAYALMGMFFVLFALFLSVVAFNRPTFVVPPHLRDEPGLYSRGGRSARASAESGPQGPVLEAPAAVIKACWVAVALAVALILVLGLSPGLLAGLAVFVMVLAGARPSGRRGTRE